MADVEVDLLLDLQEARRRLGEFRRELDGVERQAEEIQERAADRPPGPERAGPRGRRASARESPAVKKIKSGLAVIDEKIAALEDAVGVLADGLAAAGEAFDRAGQAELGQTFKRFATTADALRTSRQQLSAGVALVQSTIQPLIRAGVLPSDPAELGDLIRFLFKRGAEESKKAAQTEFDREREGKFRGLDAVLELGIQVGGS